jgi:hypothetical protein
MRIDWRSAREAYERDGVVYLPQALDKAALGAAEASYTWAVKNPGPHALTLNHLYDDMFYQNYYDPNVVHGYSEMIKSYLVPEVCEKFWGTEDVWFLYGQMFLKKGEGAGRTSWRQDEVSLTVQGSDTAVCWIAFDHVEKESALEFVRGSHRGPLYNAAQYENSEFPPMPDIEAERENWNIVSWAVTPGDLLFFDFRTLHGGGATVSGAQRRTLTLRFFGERSFYIRRQKRSLLPNVSEIDLLVPGDVFRGEGFLKLTNNANLGLASDIYSTPRM